MPVHAQSIVVRGGVPLSGAVPISGYKHALTVMVAAAVALGRTVVIQNVPCTTEIEVLEAILRQMGAGSERVASTWRLDTTTMRPGESVPRELSRLIHGSLYLVPALLARFGEVAFSGAGGDRIGSPESNRERPTAQVWAVMKLFGAMVSDRGDTIVATEQSARGATSGSRTIDLLHFSTHPEVLRGPTASSATKTALLLAAAADGPTVLRNPVNSDATRELCVFLTRCGVTVARADTEWRVSGRADAPRDPVKHHLISDSTEIVTFAAAVALAGGRVRLTGITGPRTWCALACELETFARMGLRLTHGDTWLRIDQPTGALRPASIEVDCNGFSTDAHPLLAVALLAADGESAITDHVWTSRFAYVSLLEQMGACATVEGNTVRIRPSVLRPPAAPLRPMDSRAAAVAVLAGLAAKGTTRVEDAGHLDRSYERFADKLRDLGAHVEARDSACR